MDLSRKPEATTYTPEEWVERAKGYAVKRKHHQARMRYFSKLLKVK